MSSRTRWIRAAKTAFSSDLYGCSSKAGVGAMGSVAWGIFFWLGSRSQAVPALGRVSQLYGIGLSCPRFRGCCVFEGDCGKFNGRSCR